MTQVYMHNVKAIKLFSSAKKALRALVDDNLIGTINGNEIGLNILTLSEFSTHLADEGFLEFSDSNGSSIVVERMYIE